MPIFRLPKDAAISLPPMRERPESPAWTETPGDDALYEVMVLGPGSGDPIVTSEAAAAAIKFDVGLVASRVTNDLVSLRDYQEEAISAVSRCWSEGKRSPLLVMATGAGKTICAAEIFRRFTEANAGASCLFIAHRKELLTQTLNKIKTVSPKITAGLVQASTNQLGRRITVASVQTLQANGCSRLKQILAKGQVRLAIFDEAHHAVSSTYRRVIAELRSAEPDCLFVGLTATPGREDGTGLDSVFDCIAYEKNLFDLIRDGWLVPPVGISVDLDLNFDEVDTDGEGEFKKASLSAMMNKPVINDEIVRAWGQYGQNRKMLAFCVDVAHARDLAQAFVDAGFPARHVDGSMKEKDRDAAFSAFRKGDIRVLTNCEIAVEGYDDPSAEGIIMARPTQSQALYIQAVGRGLRSYPCKTDCLVIDLVGNGERHQLVQLSALAGLDPLGSSPSRDGAEEDAAAAASAEEEEDREVVVGDVRVRDLNFLRLRRQHQLRYQWRETPMGWVLMVPRVGYLLIAPASHAGQSVIRFHDTRKGKRDAPPMEITRGPVEADMAYGLAEGYVDRMFRAAGSQSRMKEKDHDDSVMPLSSVMDIDDGLDPDVASMAQRTMETDASWRSMRTTEKQTELLRKFGIKPEHIPQVSGEAADLITIIEVERDMNARLPATNPQKAYLRQFKIPFDASLTKGQAKRLIVAHRYSH